MKKARKAKRSRSTRPGSASLLVTKKELAKVWGCSIRWIERLQREHGMPGPIHGRFNRVTHGTWYTRFLNAALERFDLASEVSNEVSRDKLRFIRAKRQRAEIKLAILRANLVPARLIKEFEAGLHQQVRSFFGDDWAEQLAQKVVGLDERAARIVFDREIRCQLEKVAALAQAPLASDKTQ